MKLSDVIMTAKKTAIGLTALTIGAGSLTCSMPMEAYAAAPPKIEAHTIVQNSQTTIAQAYEKIYDMTPEEAEIYSQKKNVIDENYLWEICEQTASKYDNVSAGQLFGLVLQESKGYTNIDEMYPDSPTYGLTQINPNIHADRIKELGYTEKDLHDNPEACIEVAAHYLDELGDKYSGDQYKALVAYNMGGNKADQRFEQNPNFNWDYANNVLDISEMAENNLGQKQAVYEIDDTRGEI